MKKINKKNRKKFMVRKKNKMQQRDDILTDAGGDEKHLLHYNRHKSIFCSFSFIYWSMVVSGN
jgi:hypothetical protein